jgi:hypothetical protein
MNLEKLKQLALIDQMGAQPQAEQQKQDAKARMAMGLMQALMQQEGESARLGVQQENLRGDQAYRTQSLADQTAERAAANAYRAQSLASQTSERTANDAARAASATAEAERLKVAQEQAATADWYAQDRYTTDAQNEAARVKAIETAGARARNVDIYKANLAAGMDPKAAAMGLNDPELQGAGIAAQEAAVRREASKYIAQIQGYPKSMRDQILNSGMKGGMHPDTRAMIEAHFNSQPTAPNVLPKQSMGPATGQTQEDFDNRSLALRALGMLQEDPERSRRFNALNSVSRPWQSDAYKGSPMYNNQQAKFDAAQKAKTEMLTPFLLQLMGTQPINLNES